VRVITVDRSTWWDRDGSDKSIEYWFLQKDGKEVALGFVDRMLVVTEASIPNEVRNLLRSDAHQRRTAHLLIKALPGSQITLWEAPTGGACQFSRVGVEYRAELLTENRWEVQQRLGVAAWTTNPNTVAFVQELDDETRDQK
jgi:hypothetical protein